jgi:hypothetical protein
MPCHRTSIVQLTSIAYSCGGKSLAKSRLNLAPSIYLGSTTITGGSRLDGIIAFSRSLFVFSIQVCKREKVVEKKRHRMGDTWYITRRDILAGKVGEGTLSSSSSSSSFCSRINSVGEAIENALLQPWHDSDPC